MKKNVIFDFGGVLVDWNPRYVYREMTDDEEKIEWFLENICNAEWNILQDAGRSFAEGTAELVAKYPEWEEWIKAYYGCWPKPLRGAIEPCVKILERLKSAGYHVFGLTNWSAESFPYVRKVAPWLPLFEDIVVSGAEKCIKPEPEIYHILLDRNHLDPSECIFIDDNPANVDGGRAVGIDDIHFTTPENLIAELNAFGVNF